MKIHPDLQRWRMEAVRAARKYDELLREEFLKYGTNLGAYDYEKLKDAWQERVNAMNGFESVVSARRFEKRVLKGKEHPDLVPQDYDPHGAWVRKGVTKIISSRWRAGQLLSEAEIIKLDERFVEIAERDELSNADCAFIERNCSYRELRGMTELPGGIYWLSCLLGFHDIVLEVAIAPDGREFVMSKELVFTPKGQQFKKWANV